MQKCASKEEKGDRHEIREMILILYRCEEPERKET
jgi:hypothetical protein